MDAMLCVAKVGMEGVRFRMRKKAARDDTKRPGDATVWECQSVYTLERWPIRVNLTCPSSNS